MATHDHAHQGTAPEEAMAAPHEHHAHDNHAGHSVEMIRRKFWVALAPTIPTLVWGHMLLAALGYTPPHLPGAHWIPAISGTAVFAVGGWPFLQGAWRELAARLPGMMTLIALAICVAFGFSAAVALGFAGTPLREELAMLVTIIAPSRATYRKMIQNLWWAAGYNIFAIALAAGVLALWRIAVNAQLLRRTAR